MFKRVFNVGDFVFAKVKGYQPWPATIYTIEKNMFIVKFYGTGEISTLSNNQLFPYTEYKQKLVNNKSLKRPFFKDSIDQIEEDMLEKLKKHMAKKKPKRNCGMATTPQKKRSRTPSVETDAVAPIASAATQQSDKHIVSSSSAGTSRCRPFETNKKSLLDDGMKMPIQETSNSLHEGNKFTQSMSSHQDLLSILIDIRLRNLEFGIKSTLQKSSANPDEALKLLKTLKELDVTQTILKKNPNCVETIKRMCVYVGNTEDWNWSAEEKSAFIEKAEKLRNISDEIYQQFQNLFVVPDGMTFSEFFTREVQIFRDRAKH